LRNFKGIVGPGVNYLAIIGILGTIELRRRLRQEALSAASIEAELARAELDQMRVQLHPQLLEDALRTTAEFVRSGASTQAVQLLARLSDVLRLTLATLGQERVALRQEVEFLSGYPSLPQNRRPGQPAEPGGHPRRGTDCRGSVARALPAGGATGLALGRRAGAHGGGDGWTAARPPPPAGHRPAGGRGHRGGGSAGSPAPAARAP